MMFNFDLAGQQHQQVQKEIPTSSGENTLSIAIFDRLQQARINELQNALAVKTAQTEMFEAVTNSLLKLVQLAPTSADARRDRREYR